MKKILLSVLACVASVCCAFGISACNGNNSSSQDGNTQSEWGNVYTKSAAYQKAVELGYEGTLEEFIKAISGKDGTNGKDGKDGVGIKNVSLNSDGELIVTLTDNNTVKVGGIPQCKHSYSDWSVGYAATCTSIGYNVRECSLCGVKDYEFIGALGHHWDNGYTVNEATCIQPGLVIYGCTTCDTVKRAVTEMTEHNFNKGVCTNCGEIDESYTVTVSFDLNYADAPDIALLAVKFGDSVTFPAAPVRAGYTFNGWSLDRNDAGQKVTSGFKPNGNVTLYALWVAERSYTVNFNRNDFSSTEPYITYSVSGGEKVTAPETDPAREGYEFLGWYTAASGGQLVDFENIVVARNTNYYAHWKSNPVVTDIFDAEFVEFDPTEMYPGYSGATYGCNCICSDDGLGATTQHETGSSAQNGYYVSYQYKKGATLSFVIYSSAAVKNATLTVRLGMELMDLIMDSSDSVTLMPEGDYAYKIKVNDASIDYGSIVLESTTENYGWNCSSFKDYTIGNISLAEGLNVIELVVDNAAYPGGTMQAAAPLVDCIKITDHGDAVLSWSPEYDNLRKIPNTSIN